MNGATKKPLRKAHVTLELAEGQHESSLVATTDELGQFRFADVQAGRYRLTASKSGFLDGTYGSKEPEGSGSLLKVDEGERLQNLTLGLFPGGVIAGQVLDADGDPLGNHSVAMWTKPDKHGHGFNESDSTTDHNGQYRFDGLEPGSYYVRANAGTWDWNVHAVPVDSNGKATKVRDMNTYYPSALSVADPQAVTVASGQEQTAIDIRIQRGTPLSVKGRIAGASGPISRYRLRANLDDGRGWASQPGRILPNGDFLFSEMPPGRYWLTLIESGPDGSHTAGAAEVTLASEDVTDVVITAFKSAQVRVKVVVEGEEDKPLTSGMVLLTPL